MQEGNPLILIFTESYKSEIEEKEKEFIQPATICYEILKSLNEDFSLPSKKHSEEWNRTFNAFYLLSAQIAESLWPKKTVKYIKNTEDKNLAENEFNSINYPLPRYENVIRDSVTHYTGFYTSKKDKDKKPKEISFWKFYRYLLLQKVSSNYSDIQIEKNLNLNSKEKSKFKSICFFFHSKNIEDIYSEEAKALLLKEKFFENREELDSFYRSLKRKDSLSSKNIEDIGFEKAEDLKEQKKSQEEILDFINLIEKCYIKKIKLKKQSAQEQADKISRTREYLCLYLIEKINKENPEYSFEQIESLLKSKKFYSSEICKFYRQREKEIEKVVYELRNSKDKSLYKKLIDLKKAPISYKEISLKHNKPYNYASRELASFLKYLENFQEEKKEKAVLKIEDIKKELTIYNNFFNTKINQKKQKSEEQEKKIKFEKDLATYILLEKITKNYQKINIEDLEEILLDFDFASRDIIQSFKQVKPLTLKEISLKNGRNEKYASKRSLPYKTLLK
ncbi:MAG: hypothetical protein K5866_10890 [Treponema sp.]|nr:hypothetical protein [Treponema sp.]